jgi:hypothetical protein
MIPISGRIDDVPGRITAVHRSLPNRCAGRFDLRKLDLKLFALGLLLRGRNQRLQLIIPRLHLGLTGLDQRRVSTSNL